MSEKKILVVDDDKDIHAIMRTVLGREYRITSAYDAVQASMFARQVQPDLVILDIGLPGGGGEKVYERLRSMPGVKTMAVLVYTAMKREDIQPPILETPDTFILFKPAAPEAIVAAVHKLVPLS